MAVLYKSFQSVLEDKNHKKMFHPRVIYTANISTSQIAKEIAAYSSLSPGDVKNTLDNLVTETPTGGSSEEYWSMGAGLNQPSSVKDDCPMGCKLLLYGNKVFHVWDFVCTI